MAGLMMTLFGAGTAIAFILAKTFRPRMLTFERSKSTILVFSGALVYSAWLGFDWLFSERSGNGIDMAAYLVFLSMFTAIRWNTTELTSIWGGVILSSLVLTAIGLARYIFGYHGAESEHSAGALTALAGGHYVYFGISYTPSTRNSDFLYLTVPFLAAITWFTMAPSRWLAPLAALVLAGLPIFLSNSRSGWIATGVAVFLVFRKYFRVWILLILIPVAFLSAEFLGIPAVTMVLNQSKAVVMSLVSPAQAAAEISNEGAFSNDDRVDLVRQGVLEVIKAPLGSGAMVNFGKHYCPRVVHFENFYLDLLVVFGILGVGCVFLLFGMPLLYHQKCAGSKMPGLYSLALSSFTMLVIMSAFNSVMDFAFFWFLLALSTVTIRCLSQGMVYTPGLVHSGIADKLE